MSVYVDLQCDRCGQFFVDQWSDRVGETHEDCGGHLERIWTFTKGPDPGTHSSEKVVVFESPQEGGKIQFPGRNDAPVPERLRQRGYVRRELNVKDLAAFEKRHNVLNERRHFNKGNGL
jgi:hypothetical protein